MIYFIVLIILLFGIKYDFRSWSKSADRYYIFECVVLVILMGLRYRVGGDALRYESYFEYSSDFQDILAYGILQGGFQPCWLILQSISKAIIDDFVFFQLIHCSIVVGVILFLANKHCKHRFTFVVLFYFSWYPYFCTEIMRESLAVVFFVLGIDFLNSKKYMHYFLMCLVAFLFHAGAVFLFILPFVFSVLSKASSLKQLSFICIGVFSVSCMFDAILDSLTDILFSGNQLLENKSDALSDSSSLNIFGIITTIVYYFCVFFAYKYLKKSSLSTPYSYFVTNMYMVTIILTMVFIPLNRLQNYFSIPFLFVFADLLYDPIISRKYKNLLLLSLSLFIYSRMSYYMTDIKSEDVNIKPIKIYQLYYPYSSIFNPKENVERENFIENQF